MSERVQLWSCGGGRQSAGMAALILQGRLPKPDHVAMVALEWEKKTTFAYVNSYVRPAIRSLGIPFTYVSRKQWATKGFWAGENNDSLLLPVYSDQSGKASKLPEFCSGKWKREVLERWANAQSGWKRRGVDSWLGITWEERTRRRGPRKQWFAAVYPLLDFLPSPLHVSACLQAVQEVGWPEPPRSRCTHCPNQVDREWLELSPQEFEDVCRLEDTLREKDSHAWFHRSMVPLRTVNLDAAADPPGLFGGCSAGTCF